MAHNLFNDANSSMAFNGETPWHGIGTRIAENAGIGDILAAVDFYKVEEREIFAAGMEGAIPDRKALFTDGVKSPARYLSTVGSGYGVVQFSEVYGPIVEAMNGKVTFKTAGLLGERGASGWLLAEMPSVLQVKGDESAYRSFLLMVAGHDGSTAVNVLGTAVRVVCQNTLRMALNDKRDETLKFTVRHTSNASKRVGDEWNTLLTRATAQQEQFGLLANALASTAFSARDASDLVDAVLPLPEGKNETEITDKARARRARLLDLVQGGAMIGPSITGSAWGAVQAVAQFADHERKAQTPAQKALPAWTRLDDVIFGGAETMKRTAFDFVMSRVNG